MPSIFGALAHNNYEKYRQGITWFFDGRGYAEGRSSSR